MVCYYYGKVCPNTNEFHSESWQSFGMKANPLPSLDTLWLDVAKAGNHGR
jgi:hypothetical protein